MRSPFFMSMLKKKCPKYLIYIYTILYAEYPPILSDSISKSFPMRKSVLITCFGYSSKEKNQLLKRKMCKEIKYICMCILLYISITCSNGLLCYSCYGKNNALDCEIITCKLSLFGDLRTVCYYQVFESGYQRRGCENVTSVLSQLTEGNMTLYYCREDYCNGYSNVFLNDTRRQYKSRETLVSDLKPSWNSTVNEYSSLTQDNTQGDSFYTNSFLIITIICIVVAIICLCCCIIKSKCLETCDCCLNTIIIGHDCAELGCCGNNSNHNSDVSHNIGSSNHNDYSDHPYSYGDTNCGGGNDLGSGDNDDGGGNDCDGDCDCDNGCSDCDCSCFD